MKIIITENQYKRLLKEESKIKLNDPSIKIEKTGINGDIIKRNKTLLTSILNVKPSLELKSDLININVNDSDFMTKITDTLDKYGIDMYVDDWQDETGKSKYFGTSINIPKLNDFTLDLSNGYVGFTFSKNF